MGVLFAVGGERTPRESMGTGVCRTAEDANLRGGLIFTLPVGSSAADSHLWLLGMLLFWVY